MSVPQPSKISSGVYFVRYIKNYMNLNVYIFQHIVHEAHSFYHVHIAILFAISILDYFTHSRIFQDGHFSVLLCIHVCIYFISIIFQHIVHVALSIYHVYIFSLDCSTHAGIAPGVHFIQYSYIYYISGRTCWIATGLSFFLCILYYTCWIATGRIVLAASPQIIHYLNVYCTMPA